MEHFLYTIEFIVQNLKVTKQNECAPFHYPYYAEFRFRKGLYLSLHQNEFSAISASDVPAEDIHEVVNPSVKSTGYQTRNKGENNTLPNGKQSRGCAFVLDRNVDESDVLDIRVYKKTNDKCKFLIGAGDVPIQSQFKSVMDKFYIFNSVKYPQNYSTRIARQPDDKNQSKSPFDPVEYEKETGTQEAAIESRKTHTTPADEVPVFKWTLEKNDMGIVAEEHPPQPDKPAAISFKVTVTLRNQKGEGSAFMTLLVRLTCMGRSLCKEIPYPAKADNCKSDKDKDKNEGSKDGYTTENTRTTLRKSTENSKSRCSLESDSLSVSSSFADSAEDESIESIPVIRPKVDRTAYDEFEADLNGCGLAIRVLKNAHKVSAVRRYEDPSSCNQCKSGTDQKTAVSKLLQLVCRVLLSLNSEQGQNASPCQPSNNAKAPTLQQICQCIQQMLGPPDAANKECGRGSTKQYNRTQSLRRDKNKIDPCRNRSRGGCECNPQRDIMLFLESIRQVVANKKGLSDLANLLMQCTCGDGSDGDNKSGFASILKIILEKIKKCADDKPSMEKQMDLCSLVRTLTEIQNTRNSTRIRAGDNRSCSSESERSSLQTSENISCLVKKILELGVKYCSNKNINLRNVLCKILSDDVCNEELSNICRTIGQYLESDRNVVCDHVRKETAGRTVNAPCLPTVRGNIKYPSNMDYGTGSFSLPLPQDCDEGNVDQYRRKFKQRECCVQIDGPDIDNTMQGINQKLPTGIEICRKGTMDLDSDVFILKMGKKAEASGKKGLIEIELRTPKGPSGGRPQLASIATQVDEDMLKERVTSTGGGGDKPKGKGKGKGKGGKGKGKKGKK